MAIRVSREQIEKLWYTKQSNAELCAALGLTKNQLWTAKHHYRLPARDTRVFAEPDADEIAAMCRVIQAGWSDEERDRRYVGATTVKTLEPLGRLR